MNKSFESIISMSKLLISSDEGTLQLKNCIQAFPSSSYSCILSTVAYLCFEYPDLPPFGFEKVEHNTPDKSFPNQYLSYNHYYEPWCDYFGSFLWDKTKGFFYQHEDILYIVMHVTKQQMELFLSKKNLFQYYPIKCSQIKDLAMIVKKQLQSIKKQKNIGLINLTTSQLRTDRRRPKVDMVCLLSGFLYRQSDEWKRYNVLMDEFPTEEQFATIDTLILTGSGLSVNEEEVHVEKFGKMLKVALEKNKQLKVIGLCFGHQLLAKIYEGQIGKIDLVSGIEKISFQIPPHANFSYLSQITEFSEKFFFLSEYHSDSVVKVPQDFQIIGSSQTCQTQSMLSKDGRCLSFQFHAEYTNQYTKGYELRVANYQVDDWLANFAGNIREEFKSEEAWKHHKRSCIQIRKLLRAFIQWSPLS